MDIEGIVQALIPVVKEIIVGMLLMSDSGVIGGAREAGAITDYLKKGPVTFAGNPIIEHLAETLLAEGNLQLPDLSSLDATHLLQTVADVGADLDTLEGGVQVKQFIYGLAEHIAGASGGGLFGRGQKISTGEQQILDALRGQLGI